MTIQVADVFTDTDAVSLDAHTPTPTNTPGGAWSEVNGNWDINGNRARLSANGTNGCAAIDCDFADGDLSLEAASQAANTATSQDAGLTARVSDGSNYWKIGINAQADAFRIVERNAATDTVRATASVTIDAGTFYTLTAQLSGQTITAQIEGGNEITYGSAALNETSQLHGLMMRLNTERVDDFSADDGAGGGAVNTETGGAQAPAVAGGADQSVFGELGGARSPAVAGAAEQTVYGETGQASAPSVAGGVDEAVYSETATADVPAAAGGADSVTYTEEVGGYAPAVAGALDQVVYTETGGAVAGAVAGGESATGSANVYTKTGGAQSALAAGGADAVAFGEMGGAETPAVGEGTDSVVWLEAGGASAPGVAGGATGGAAMAGGDIGWVPFGNPLLTGAVGPEVTYGKSLKDRMRREKQAEPERAMVEDEALLMLL